MSVRAFSLTKSTWNNARYGMQPILF